MRTTDITQGTYEAMVTKAIDEITGGDFEYPESFDYDVSVCFMNRMPVEGAANSLLAEYTNKTGEVAVRLMHSSSIPGTRWVEPVGWKPKNVIDGYESDDGSWWDDSEEIAGLVWFGNPAEACEGDVIDVRVDDLRVASCGDCRVIESVKV